MRRGVPVVLACSILAAGPVFVSGCNDDGGTKPKVLTVGELAGAWNVTKYEVTHDTIPAMTLDFIQFGAVITIEATATGFFTGTAVMVLPGGTEPTTIPLAGAFTVDETTVTVVFTPELEYFTGFSGPYEYDGEKITVVDEDATYDFDGDEQDDPATATVVIERM